MPETPVESYRRIRREERDALLRRMKAAYARAPRLADIARERGELVSAAGKRAVVLDECRRRLGALDAEEKEILSSLGLPPDELTLRYRCAVCRDTGLVGEIDPVPCACRLKLREAQLGGAGVNERETFSAFSESIYPSEEQKRRAVNAMRICKSYAEELPAPVKPNLLLLGMPGLGKSYLGNAIAYAAISRGVDAERATAYRFIQDVLAGMRARGDDPARRYQSVPLLVLDDLGSEPEIPNVSVEWLFAVLNERVLSRRATVVITNLTLAELKARYGERVMSRLCDQNTTLVMRLTGDNLRVV